MIVKIFKVICLALLYNKIIKKMIKDLLYSAACSPNQNQRNNCIQRLNHQCQTQPQRTLDQMFNLLCSEIRQNHILSYSFLKKMINDSQKQKLVEMNHRIQKAYFYWFQKNLNRNTFQQISFQKQNLVQLHALYLGLNTSGKYREQFVDIIPFKILQLYNKGYKQQLFGYLEYYGQVLKLLRKYRVGNIYSRKAAMGSIMLQKITTKLDLFDSYQASFWLKFIISFSNFNSWSPNSNFLINCLIKYKITKNSLISLLDYLSINFKMIWSLQDQCKILYGLNDRMRICQQQIQQYKCIDVQKILKCFKTYLHNFFVTEKPIQNTAQAIMIESIQSYEQFERIGKFIINMIDYFSFNNEKQSVGNLSQMIVQYSGQILRLYSNYLDEQKINDYSKRFIQSITNNNNERNQFKYQKIFVFFSSLPKSLLQMFDYQRGIQSILERTINLSQNYEPVYINFINHYININYHLQLNTILKIAGFLISLINSRQDSFVNFQGMSQFNGEDEEITKKIERISLSIYSLSKLSKYKNFTDVNKDYFIFVKNKIFNYLIKSKNQFSILIEAAQELIYQNKEQWNYQICKKSIQNLLIINAISQSSQRTTYNQLQIQFYRMIKRTFNLDQYCQSISNQMMFQNSYNKVTPQNWESLEHLILILSLQQKPQSVKQQITFMIQQIVVQLNRILYLKRYQQLQILLNNLIQGLVKNQLFQYINIILVENWQKGNNENIQTQILQHLNVGNQQYDVIDFGFSKELYISAIKILLQLTLHQQYIEIIFFTIQKFTQKQLYCIWQALQILYPAKISGDVLPAKVKQRIYKITTGNILSLFQNLDLNKQAQIILKQTPTWNKLYRNILRQDSIVNLVIQQKIKNYTL